MWFPVAANTCSHLHLIQHDHVIVHTIRTRNINSDIGLHKLVTVGRAVNLFFSFSLQCRGWGTDLVPPHMSDLYHKQIELHEAAARRESLSALSLAISSPRYDYDYRSAAVRPLASAILMALKGIFIWTFTFFYRGASESSSIGKAVSSTGDRISPSKSASLGRPSRPRTAPPNRAYSKSSRSESAHPVSDIGAFYRKDVTDAVVTSKKQPPTTTTTPSAGI